MVTGKEVLNSPEVRAFLAHFKMPNPFADSEEFLEALRQNDPRYKGEDHKLRFELEDDSTKWPTATVDVVMSTARYMGMLKTETIIEGEFDLMIVLGEARRSNLERTRYGVKMITDGYCSAPFVLVAGSNRPLPKLEQAYVAKYAPFAETEFDLCCAAAKEVAIESEIATGQFLVRNERAGTPDVIEAVIGAGEYDEFIRIATVTNQIYWLATVLDTARISADFCVACYATAGCPSDPKVVDKRTTATYLSEVLRTLRAALLAAEAGV